MFYYPNDVNSDIMQCSNAKAKWLVNKQIRLVLIVACVCLLSFTQFQRNLQCCMSVRSECNANEDLFIELLSTTNRGNSWQHALLGDLPHIQLNSFGVCKFT